MPKNPPSRVFIELPRSDTSARLRDRIGEEASAIGVTQQYLTALIVRSFFEDLDAGKRTLRPATSTTD